MKLGIICINIFLLFLLYNNLFTYPNTFIGTTNVSGKTAGQIHTILKQEAAIHPKIQAKERTYQYTYAQLGIVIDEEKAVNDVFAPNRKLFPFFQSFFIRHTISPPLVFTQTFDQFIYDMTFNFGDTPNSISVDPETKAVIVAENNENYRFDKTNIQTLLLSHFGNYSHPIYPMLAKVTNETINQITDVNQKIAQIFSHPIMMYLDMGGTTEAVELKEEDVREATIITTTPTFQITLAVDPVALNRVLIQRIHSSGFPIRDNLVTQQLQNDFLQAVQLRYAGADITAISTTTDDGPNTDGSIANKYIEVDISQQKMYIFHNGVVEKTYRVSTGLDEPTPIGKFTILNKLDVGYSNIYHVCMPYWMGFSYSEKLHAYFGIHEQPYTLTPGGKPILDDIRLGTPTTGGCIALAPEAAQEVFSFAEIGTPVYIYN